MRQGQLIEAARNPTSLSYAFWALSAPVQFRPRAASSNCSITGCASPTIVRSARRAIGALPRNSIEFDRHWARFHVPTFWFLKKKSSAVLRRIHALFVRIGWAVSAVNDRHVTIKALEMALKRRCPEIGLLHHSDQGCTYASEDHQAILEMRGLV